MNPPKRIKLNPTPCLKTFVIPDTDFTLETIMSLALLSFLHPISDPSQIQFIDPLKDIPYSTLTDQNIFIIGVGGKYISNCQTFHWKEQTKLQKQKGKQKGRGKQDKKAALGDQHFNDSKRCKLTPLSAVGLIYKLYGKLIICNITNMSINDASLNWLFERCYFDYIEIIDAYTREIKLYNGQPQGDARFNNENLLLPSIIKYYNVQHGDNDDEEVKKLRIQKIFETISILKLGFSNFLKYFAFSFIRGKQIIIDNYGKPIPNIDPKLSDQIIILSEFIPWKEHIFNYEKEIDKLGTLKYVIFKDTSNSWRIYCVPINPSSFESRKKLPLKWRGLETDQLREISGIDDIVFVHVNGFIGGAESLDGCLQMAVQSLLNQDEQEQV